MRILVPLDTSKLSQIALPWAISLAEGLGGELLLLIIADTRSRVALERFAQIEHRTPLDMLQAGLEAAQRSIVEVPVTSLLLPGRNPASTIVDRATQEEVSMIVMASHGLSGFRRWRLGSVADHVVRRATVPVLVVPAPWRAERPEGVTSEERSSDGEAELATVGGRDDPS